MGVIVWDWENGDVQLIRRLLEQAYADGMLEKLEWDPELLQIVHVSESGALQYFREVRFTRDDPGAIILQYVKHGVSYQPPHIGVVDVEASDSWVAAVLEGIMRSIQRTNPSWLTRAMQKYLPS